MSRFRNIFLLIVSVMFFLFLFIALILYFAGVRGAVGLSPSLRGYIARVISDTGKSTILKIPQVTMLETKSVNNFFDFILNVGLVIANMFIGVINAIIWLWNIEVTIITFIVKLITLFIELKPEIFEVDSNAWWWQEVGNTSVSASSSI